MLRASQTATRALAPFARRGFPLKLAPFARRGFSVWPTSAELKLHSGLLALPASSAARASDRERLSSAFGRIEERGRLYVGLVGKYDLAIDEPTFKTVLERFHQIYHLSASLRPDAVIKSELASLELHLHTSSALVLCHKRCWSPLLKTRIPSRPKVATPRLRVA